MTIKKALRRAVNVAVLAVMFTVGLPILLFVAFLDWLVGGEP